MDVIYESDVDWDAELRAEVQRMYEHDAWRERQAAYAREVAGCCGGRIKDCIHYGTGA